MHGAAVRSASCVLCSKKGKGKAAAEAAAPITAPTQGEEEYGKEVDAMPQFAALGKRFRSCKSVRVSEEDTEYVV